jgi:hypothetical protein
VTTQTETRIFSIVPPTGSAVVPVQAHPVPAPQPPKEPIFTLAKARDFLEKTDLDGSRAEHGGSRTWATLNNGLSAALSAGHCIPVVSWFCAPASIGFGGAKVLAGLCSLFGDGDMSGIARGLMISGAKSMVVGASVFLLPGVSEALSIWLAVKDGADAVNASID